MVVTVIVHCDRAHTIQLAAAPPRQGRLGLVSEVSPGEYAEALGSFASGVTLLTLREDLDDIGTTVRFPLARPERGGPVHLDETHPVESTLQRRRARE